MKRFLLAFALALFGSSVLALGRSWSQPLPLPPAPNLDGKVQWTTAQGPREEKKIAPLAPAPTPPEAKPPTPVPTPSVPKTPEEKKPLQDPTMDPKIHELLNPTQAVALKQVPVVIKGRVVTPAGASVLLDFGGRTLMVRKGAVVTVQGSDGASTYRIVDITESEVLLETPAKNTISIR
jgi:hypothetical protein